VAVGGTGVGVGDGGRRVGVKVGGKAEVGVVASVGVGVGVLVAPIAPINGTPYLTVTATTSATTNKIRTPTKAAHK
jgi:hypothetical protein